ncbi:MAG: hypothetical protein JWM54_1722 [Acidobacteriaceae bacterium]|nr:hypothetical protein [Acidobacteriaceae bacterium]
MQSAQRPGLVPQLIPSSAQKATAFRDYVTLAAADPTGVPGEQFPVLKASCSHLTSVQREALALSMELLA